jgi:hypothetical protein
MTENRVNLESCLDMADRWMVARSFDGLAWIPAIVVQSCFVVVSILILEPPAILMIVITLDSSMHAVLKYRHPSRPCRDFAGPREWCGE